MSTLLSDLRFAFRQLRKSPGPSRKTCMRGRNDAGRNELLRALKAELIFFDASGYGHPFRSQWRPTLLLRDSPVCVNFGAAGPTRECRECPFYSLVPDKLRSTSLPCHAIPLRPHGFTVAELYRKGTQKALDENYREWLCATIQKFEQD